MIVRTELSQLSKLWHARSVKEEPSQRDKEAYRQTVRQTDRQTDRQTYIVGSCTTVHVLDRTTAEDKNVGFEGRNINIMSSNLQCVCDCVCV